MHPLIRFLLRAGGVFCILCGVVPLLVYGIVNTGTVAMLVLGVPVFLLPTAWSTLLANHPRTRAMVAVAGCAGLTLLLVISALIAHRAWFDAPPDTGETAVIVLGAKVNGDTPSLMLRRRLDKAAEYLERNPDAFCIVSGGQGPDEDYPEAEVMQRYLLHLGIDGARIRVENRSTNTRQNLRYSRELLGGAEQVVIVTDGFHQLRAGMFARAEGLSSYHLSSLTPWGLMPSYWLREVLAVCWAWVSIRFGLA